MLFQCRARCLWNHALLEEACYEALGPRRGPQVGASSSSSSSCSLAGHHIGNFPPGVLTPGPPSLYLYSQWLNFLMRPLSFLQSGPHGYLGMSVADPCYPCRGMLRIDKSSLEISFAVSEWSKRQINLDLQSEQVKVNMPASVLCHS